MAKEKVRPVDATQFTMTDATPDTYIPEGFDSVEEFLTDLREEYEADITFDEYNRREAIDDKKFAIGDQWDPEVLKIREGLPSLTINSIPQFTAQLVGDWRQQRNSIKVLPSEDGDENIASVRGDLIRAIEYTSRADRVYDDAFESMVTCGDGAYRISVEYARDDVFDQNIFMRGIEDCMSVTWDRMSMDPTGRDARHVFVEDSIPTKEYKRKWKDVPSDYIGKTQYVNLRQGSWVDDKTTKVLEYWRMIERDKLICLFADGSIHPVEADSLEQIVQTHGQPVKTRIAPILYAQMHLVTGWKILSGPYEYKLNRVPIIRMMGRVMNIEGQRTRYGLVRFMKDPARLRNFWRSTAAEQLGYAPKAQWMATESAVAGREDTLRKAHLSRDPLLVFNDEAAFGQNVQRVDPPQMQTALLNEAQINTQDMKDVTGIHDASLGIRSNETSGRAIRARQEEGDLASLTFYDNGNSALLEGGDVVNQLIPQVIDGTRTLRLIGEDQAPKMVKVNDPYDPESPDLSIGNYDVALSTGASYATRRAAAADAMMQAIQVAPELMTIAGDLIVKAQDWPGADKLAERMKRTIPPQLLGPDEQDPNAQPQQPQIDPKEVQQAMEKMQQLTQENEMLKLKLQNKEHELTIKEYDSETLRIRALSDNEVDGNNLELNAIGEILAHSRETQKARAAQAATEAKESAASEAKETSEPANEPS